MPGHHSDWQFSSTGRVIYAVERDSNQLLRYEGPTFARGEVLQEIKFDGTGIFSQSKTLGGILMSFHGAAFFADGTRLLAGSSGSEAIKVWETQGYNELLTLEGDGSHYYSIKFSVEGSLLGALNAQGKLHLWRAPTWEEINAVEKTAEAATDKRK